MFRTVYPEYGVCVCFNALLGVSEKAAINQKGINHTRDAQ